MFQLRLPDLAREAPTWDKDHGRMTVLLTVGYVMNSDAVRSRDVSVLLGICWTTQKSLRQYQQYYESKLGTNHELNRVVSYLLNPAHWMCPLLLVNICHNDQAFRDFSIDVRHRFILQEAIRPTAESSTELPPFLRHQ
jgi:hypothetical protein